MPLTYIVIVALYLLAGAYVAYLCHSQEMRKREPYEYRHQFGYGYRRAVYESIVMNTLLGPVIAVGWFVIAAVRGFVRGLE